MSSSSLAFTLCSYMCALLLTMQPRNIWLYCRGTATVSKSKAKHDKIVSVRWAVELLEPQLPPHQMAS